MQELEYLRNEMNQRINFFYEHHHKVIGNVLLLWGGLLVIFTAVLKFWVDESKGIDVFSFFMVITIFFISVMIVYFASQRTNENVNQIFRIAAYIAVFYEKRPDNANDRENFWELATFDMMIKEMKTRHGKRNYTMDYEHVFLPFFAVIMMIFLFSVLVFKIPDITHPMGVLGYLMVATCLVFIGVSLIFSLKIKDYAGLNPQKWFDIKKDHLKSFIEYAKETGYYTEFDIVDRFGNKFLNDIGYAFNCNRCRITFSKGGFMGIRKILKMLSATIVAVIVTAAEVFAAASDTAYVPFKVNVDAQVTAVRNGNAVSIYVDGGEVDTLKLPLEKPLSVRSASGAQGQLNAPTVTGSRGNITLRLPAQSYQNAEVALYSVNGKQILRGKAAATDAASSVSRLNAAAGVYLLSVKGINGSVFTTRLTHSGGKMNINVAFGAENASLSPAREPGKKANTYEVDWEITVRALSGECEDSRYTLNLTAGGEYPLQYIVLVRRFWMTANLTGFFNWEAAKTACPTGWRLPTSAESSTFPKSMATFNGYDNTGFGNIIEVGSYGFWWTSTQNSSGTAVGWYAWKIRGDTIWGSMNEPTSHRLSVRCVLNPVEIGKYTYTIRFDANGGTVTPASDTTDENGKLTSLPTPTRSGYTFNGWYSAVTDATVTKDRVYTGNTTIYARWTGIPTPTKTTFTDERDGTTYNKVTIGTQVWMAENLNYATTNSVCYENRADSCAKYGRLYTWADSKRACPAGWHIPTSEEWGTLIDYVGFSDAASNLKAASGWSDCGPTGTGSPYTCNDTYSFVALPGGCYYSYSIFDIIGAGIGFSNAGSDGYWWAASEVIAHSSLLHIMDNDDYGMYRNYDNENNLFSVRCVQD